jgi:hypothetical protein
MERPPRQAVPRLTARISVRVEPSLKAHTKRVAASIGVTESELVEFLLLTDKTVNTPSETLAAAVRARRADKESPDGP